MRHNTVFGLLFLASTTFAAKTPESTSGKKYDIPPAPAGYTFTTADKEFSIHSSFYTQGRVTYLESESGAARADSLSFNIARARPVFDGYLFSEKAKYYAQLELTTLPGFLVDLYMDYEFAPAFAFKFGLFKVPFTRLFLTPTNDLSFAELMTNDGNFSLTRDVGFNIHGLLPGDRVKYNLFVVNGHNTAAAATNLEPVLGFRVDASVLGKDPGYSEISYNLESGPNLTAGLATAVDLGSSNAAIPGSVLFRLTSDVIFQHSCLTAIGAFHFVHNKTTTGANPGSDQNLGFEGLISTWIYPKVLVAVKGGGTFRQDAGAFGEGNRNEYEAGTAISYYIYKRHVKFTADYTAELNNTKADNVDHRIRGQLQLWL